MGASSSSQGWPVISATLELGQGRRHGQDDFGISVLHLTINILPTLGEAETSPWLLCLRLDSTASRFILPWGQTATVFHQQANMASSSGIPFPSNTHLSGLWATEDPGPLAPASHRLAWRYLLLPLLLNAPSEAGVLSLYCLESGRDEVPLGSAPVLVTCLVAQAKH